MCRIVYLEKLELLVQTVYNKNTNNKKMLTII